MVDSSNLVPALDIDVSGMPDMPHLGRLVLRAFDPAQESLEISSEVSSVTGRRAVPIDTRFAWGDFEALSYCWESDVREKDVLVDDIVVQVPRNPEALLQKLQHLPEARSGMCFWIDGLCIDQDNTLEKNHQVQLMKRIYTQALGVIVWLGECDGESDRAMDIITQIADIQADIDAEGETSSWSVDSIRRWIAEVPWESVLAVLSRNYWKRMWIIQELALNLNMSLFMCGIRQLPRQAIWRACLFCQDYAKDIDQVLAQSGSNAQGSSDLPRREVWQTAYNVSNLFTLDASTESPKLETVLDLARKSNVKDPRDKIYGLLGLLPHSVATSILPDYSKSKEEVYLNFASTILKNCKRLDEVLSWCSFVERSSLPSWVPDWATTFNRYQLQWLRRRKAGGETTPTWSLSEISSGLRSKGTMVDIVECTGFSPSQSIPYRTVQQSEAKSPMKKPAFGRYHDKDQLAQAMNRSLLQAHPNAHENDNLLDIYWVDWDQLEVPDPGAFK